MLYLNFMRQKLFGDLKKNDQYVSTKIFVSCISYKIFAVEYFSSLVIFTKTVYLNFLSLPFVLYQCYLSKHFLNIITSAAGEIFVFSDVGNTDFLILLFLKRSF